VLRAEEGDGGGKASARTIILELPDELPSVVGLPEQVLHIDHAAFQMALDALDE